jgi:hypothetical protein
VAGGKALGSTVRCAVHVLLSFHKHHRDSVQLDSALKKWSRGNLMWSMSFPDSGCLER